MNKIILIYGTVAGVVTISVMLVANSLLGGGSFSIWFGYLVMLVALSAIFVGVKRYRDQELGGVIKFGKAFQLGLGIAIVAGLAYVVTWESYLAITDYAFIEDYTSAIVSDAVDNGLGGDELRQLESEMTEMREQYGSPLYRLPMTFLEIFPVGLLVSLISAALLRNPRVMPA